MVKAQKIMRCKALTLGAILSIGLLGGDVNAVPTPDPFSDLSGLSGLKAAKVIRQDTATLDKNKQEADALAQQQAKLQKPDPAISQRLGQIDRENKQIADTGGYGLQHFPSDSYVLSAVADQAMRTDPKRAQALADQAVASAGDDKKRIVDAYNTRSLIAEKMGNFPAAAADAKRVLAVDPTNKDALGRWHANKDRAGAGGPPPAAKALAPVAAPVVAPNPNNDPRLLANAQNQVAMERLRDAKRLLDMKDAAGALRVLQGLQTSNANLNGAGYATQAQAWSVLGDLSKAVLQISEAIKLFADKKDLAAAYSQRASYQNDLKNSDAAIADANKALENDPKRASAYYERARAMEATNHPDQALADMAQAAALDSNFMSDLDGMRQRHRKEAGESAVSSARTPSVWSRILNATGGIFPLIVGTAGSLLFVFAGYVLFSAKEGSPASRIKKRWFTPPPASDESPRVIGGHIELQGELDRGGMGVVLKGFDNKLQRPVAVKRLRPELQDRKRERDRILEEAQTLAKFHHPNIVEVHEVITEDEDIFIVCPLLDGHTVHAEINGQYLKPRRVLELAFAVAQAIDYAHDKGVIHRDLKPSNVMVTKDGRILVMDFGISRINVNHSRVTQTANIVGTPAYMAPEQEMGAVCKQSDVWALAASIYEMLSGCLPFGTSDLSRKLEKRPGRFLALSSLRSGLPPALDAVFEKALDGDPALRHRNCMEFFRDLAAVLRTLP